MVLPKKKVLPPPRQPGTHSNAEVKEAIHARAKLRTILITAVVILLLAALSAVTSTAREYTGPDNAEHYPKAIVIVAEGLTTRMWHRSMASNKAPFTQLLNNSGGIYTTLNADYSVTEGEQEASTDGTAMTQLVRLLTGATTPASPSSLSSAAAGHLPSFLQSLKKGKYKPVIVAPAQFWSSPLATSDDDGDDKTCERVGFFDAECTGAACPGKNENAYCNAFRKFVSCDGESELYHGDIPNAFSQTLLASADLLYIQLGGLKDIVGGGATEEYLRVRSDVNLLDSAVGKIALALAERTKERAENWLIIVTTEGANVNWTAPLLMAAYSNGQLVQLKRPAEHHNLRTTDVRGTLFHWFNVLKDQVDESRLLGICSTGASVANCYTTAV